MPSTERKNVRGYLNFSLYMIDNNQVTNSGYYLERRHLQAVVGGVVEEMSRNERCREDGVRKGETQHCRVHARLGAFYQSGCLFSKIYLVWWVLVVCSSVAKPQCNIAN